MSPPAITSLRFAIRHYAAAANAIFFAAMIMLPFAAITPLRLPDALMLRIDTISMICR